VGRFTLDVLLEGDPASGWVARSPAVGVWSEIPAPGSALDQTGAGVLTQAGRRYRLRLPADAVGFVCEAPTDARKSIDVEWGQELFRVAALTDESATRAWRDPEVEAEKTPTDVLVAPTDGVFYARPSPGAPAFVSPGDTLTTGQPVGLIEVMKTFNHVPFAGPGVPASAVTGEILVADGEEVRAGDAILRYEPA